MIMLLGLVPEPLSSIGKSHCHEVVEDESY